MKILFPLFLVLLSSCTDLADFNFRNQSSSLLSITQSSDSSSSETSSILSSDISSDISSTASSEVSSEISSVISSTISSEASSVMSVSANFTLFQNFNNMDSSVISNAGTVTFASTNIMPEHSWWLVPEGAVCYNDNQFNLATNAYIYAYGKTNVNLMTNQNGTTNNSIVVYICNWMMFSVNMKFVLWDGSSYSSLSANYLITRTNTMKCVIPFNDISGVDLTKILTFSPVFWSENAAVNIDFIYATNE